MIVDIYTYLGVTIFEEWVDTDLNGDPGALLYRTENGSKYYTSLDKVKKSIEKSQTLNF